MADGAHVFDLAAIKMKVKEQKSKKGNEIPRMKRIRWESLTDEDFFILGTSENRCNHVMGWTEGRKPQVRYHREDHRSYLSSKPSEIFWGWKLGVKLSIGQQNKKTIHQVFIWEKIRGKKIRKKMTCNTKNMDLTQWSMSRNPKWLECCRPRNIFPK